jgi:cell division protein FtsL
MKLSPPSEQTSFYEVFSDLIFATMAIFVLIIIVLIIQVRPEGVPAEEVAELEKEIEEQAKELEETQKKLEDAIATAAVELIVVVDGSGSMQPTMDELKGSIVSIAKTIPIVTSEFRLGLVIYRSELEIFPVRQILAEDKDGGRSLASVSRFTERLQPRSDVAGIDDGVIKALSMYQSPSSRKSLIVLGDVGPYESNYVPPSSLSLDCNDTTREQRTISAVRRFGAQNENFRIFTLFTAGGAPSNCPETTVPFFREMAATLGDDGQYSADLSELFVFLLQGALGGTTLLLTTTTTVWAPTRKARTGSLSHAMPVAEACRPR